MKKIPLPPQKLRFMAKDDASFIEIGDYYLGEALRYVVPSTVLDIGCGYGRFAYALHRRRFGGRYYGLDILLPQINWLSENFTSAAPHYRFKHADILNDRYNPQGTLETHEVDLTPGFVPDLTTLLSVFTHMYEGDVANYLAKLRDVLLPDQSIVIATFFLLSEDQARRSDYSFTHRINDHCYYLNEQDPLHAIAYEEDWLRDLLNCSGFHCIDVTYAFQDIVVFTPR